MLKLSLLAAAFSSSVFAGPSLISRAGLKDCLTTAGLETYVPGDAGYADASAPYNLRLTPQPAGVTYPTTTAQVAAAIGCAKNNGVSITSRSGGHSYAGFSDQSGELVLDLKAFNSFSFNANSQTATFGPGIRLGDLALALNENGQAMPHGTCPTVGSGGHIAHGGYGFYSRLWGLAMDRVIGHEVVLADGSVVQTSATQNTDLFWALKGAAPSYGVITSYTTTTEPVPHGNVQILITWDLTAQQAADAFIRFQDYLPTAPQELGYAFRMFKGQTSSTLRLDFVGQFKGTVDDLMDTLGPQINALPAPVSQTVNAIDWIPLLEWLGGTPLNTSTGPHVTDTFYAKSLAVFEDSPMTDTQAMSLTNYLATTGLSTSLSWFAMADNWGGASAINSVPLDSTSFGSRSNLFGWQLYGFTPDSQPPFPADGIDFVQGIYDSIVNSAPAGWKYNAYSNYVDPQLSRDQAHTLYYGEHVARLQSLKDQYDPQNVFSFPQSFLP